MIYAYSHALDSQRLGDTNLPWPHRPWVMAAICALGADAANLVFNHPSDDILPLWRTAFAAAIAVAAILFALVGELRRWRWAVGFAATWGLLLGFVAWQVAQGSREGSAFAWPFLSGLFAAVLATPLFQTWRDFAPGWRSWKLWRLPYRRLHSQIWGDVVIATASLAFVGVAFLLIGLIGRIFHLIGIDLVQDLLNNEWFPWGLAGGAFGSAVGLLREHDKLVAALQRLAMVVLAVLAPVLAAALVIFLLSLAGAGLQKLWETGVSTAALMAAVAAFAVLLVNAVIGSGPGDRIAHPIFRGAALVLIVTILPIAVIMLYAIYVRVGQYGWTPERIWGAIAGSTVLVYGIFGIWAVGRARCLFEVMLRRIQKKFMIGLAFVALLLALPISDFGAISARNQLMRLKSGVPVETFDWAAMAYDFGPTGRAMLEELAHSSQKAHADAAQIALSAQSRWDITEEGGRTLLKPIAERLRVVPAGHKLPGAALKWIAGSDTCHRAKACVAVWLANDRLAILGQGKPGDAINFGFVSRNEDGLWIEGDPSEDMLGARPAIDLSTADVTIEATKQRRILVNGMPDMRTFE